MSIIAASGSGVPVDPRDIGCFGDGKDGDKIEYAPDRPPPSSSQWTFPASLHEAKADGAV